LGSLRFKVIDTAGLEQAEDASLVGRMRAQTKAAIRDADLVLFMIDIRVGVTPADEHFAETVRRSGKPVLLVANKAESRTGMTGPDEAYALGLGDPVAISAEHNEGMADLADAIALALPASADRDDDIAETDAAVTGEEGEEEAIAVVAGIARPLRITVVGRP